MHFVLHLPIKLNTFYNFMKVFEILILFIRASRQNDWDLHLESLNDFCIFLRKINLTTQE